MIKGIKHPPFFKATKDGKVISFSHIEENGRDKVMVRYFDKSRGDIIIQYFERKKKEKVTKNE